MRSSPQHFRNDAANRCAVCDQKFGLVQHYSQRMALCSRKCRDRFRARKENDRIWLGTDGRGIRLALQGWSCVLIAAATNPTYF